MILIALLRQQIFLTSQAREDPYSTFMAVEVATSVRHCHVSLATGEVLQQDLVWADGINDTPPDCRLQLVVQSIAVRVRRDILWIGAYVLHWAIQVEMRLNAFARK